MVNMERAKEKLMDEEVQFSSVPITEKAISSEGASNLEEYVRGVVGDYLQEQTQSSNFFPIRLDPNIYDPAYLYYQTPYLSFLEAKGRRQRTDTTKLQYIHLTEGFTAEFIEETGNTTDDGVASTQLKSATINVMAMKISLSDLIGKGASASARAQLLDFAQLGFRESLENALINGNGQNNKPVGLRKTVVDSGLKIDLNSAPITPEVIMDAETSLFESRKARATFMLTSPSVVNILIDKLPETYQYVINSTGRGYEVVPGTTVPMFNTSNGPIPVIQSPYMLQNGTNSDLIMADHTSIFIHDFIPPSYVEAGRVKPLASDGWLVNVFMTYNVLPTKTAIIQGIAPQP